MEKILFLGNDARTHAMVEAVAYRAKIFSYMTLPNYAILERSASTRIGQWSELERIMDFVSEVKPDLVIAGPDDAIETGIGDKIRARGIPFVGPGKNPARIETSKVFARRLIAKAEPSLNPQFRIFDNVNGLEEYFTELGLFVIKPDGLTSGKGVRVYETGMREPSALPYARSILARDGVVLVEEKLEGREFTLQSFADGRGLVHTFPIRDYKRLLDGDQGPNTGSMGSCNDANLNLPFLTREDVESAEKANERIFTALQRELGEEFRGILYGSFMKTEQGLKIIEYNARFGDPEALNVLSLLETDFLEVAYGVANGNLPASRVGFRKSASVCKYVVPHGYPNDAPARTPVSLLKPLPIDVKMYVGSVVKENSGLHFTKSRGFAFVGVGKTLQEAELLAEQGARRVRGNVYHRMDIGIL